jgi:hypothetical protein
VEGARRRSGLEDWNWGLGFLVALLRKGELEEVVRWFGDSWPDENQESIGAFLGYSVTSGRTGG